MVVVTIIAILATIAVPSMALRIRDRRSQEAAQKVAAVYRTARLRAMGRGSAILVRFDSGTFDVYEAILGDAAPSANCFNLPSSSCTRTDWSSDQKRKATTHFAVSERGEYSGISITSATTFLDVCFTPLGAAYQRTGSSDTLTPMAGARTFTVKRDAEGIARTIAVLPNGVARLGL